MVVYWSWTSHARLSIIVSISSLCNLNAFTCTLNAHQAVLWNRPKYGCELRSVGSKHHQVLNASPVDWWKLIGWCWPCYLANQDSHGKSIIIKKKTLLDKQLQRLHFRKYPNFSGNGVSSYLSVSALRCQNCSTLYKFSLILLTYRRLEVLVLFLDGLRVVVCCALVQGQCGDLLVGFPTVAALVGFTGRMNHLMLVQTRVLGETLVTARNGANVRSFAWGQKNG